VTTEELQALLYAVVEEGSRAKPEPDGSLPEEAQARMEKLLALLDEEEAPRA
jgi:hypothetical protein